MKELSQLRPLATEARMKVVDVAATEVGCHIGGSLSVMDLLLYALSRYQSDSANSIVLSKGHAAAALYSALNVLGLGEDPTLNYGKSHSLFTGHPNHKIPNIRFSTGSLGHGIGYGAGWALAHHGNSNRGISVILSGDGELQEGLCWEVLQVVAAKEINNLIYVIDRNGAQNDGYVRDISPMPYLLVQMQAYGFDVVEIDGHDFEQIDAAFNTHRNKPLVIIANTVKGKGIAALEDNPACHYAKIKRNQAIKWKRELADVVE